MPNDIQLCIHRYTHRPVHIYIIEAFWMCIPVHTHSYIPLLIYIPTHPHMNLCAHIYTRAHISTFTQYIYIIHIFLHIHIRHKGTYIIEAAWSVDF